MFIPVAGVTARQLNDSFGYARDGGARSHKGIDIFAKEGTPVIAVRGGVVVKAGEAGKGGIRVWVKDDHGMYHYYAHLNSVAVQTGQRVRAGQRLGGVGTTGNARGTDPHLHYSLNPDGTSEKTSVNPYQFLTARRSDGGLQSVAFEDAPEPTEATSASTAQATPQQLVAEIMRAVSQSTAQAGGGVLDVTSMFGDVFAETSPSDTDVAQFGDVFGGTAYVEGDGLLGEEVEGRSAVGEI
jgi:hypothetical protein